MVDIPEGTILSQRYKIEKKIGSGGFGSVYLVFDAEENKNKALKRVLTSNNQIVHSKEIEILLSLKIDPSPYIIKYYCHFRGKDSIYIITDYYDNGDLLVIIKRLKKDGEKLPNEKLNFWSIQLIKGLFFLHQNNIIHRDIKPNNIFVTKLGDLVIGDLGISRYDEETKKTAVGTLDYLSPEMILGKEYDRKIDMWSFGCVIYELILLEKLFNGKSEFELMQSILKKEIKIPKIENSIIRNILQRCLKREPEERIDSREAYQLVHTDHEISDNLNKMKINFENFKCVKVVKLHTFIANCFTVLSTGELVSGSTDSIVRIWNIDKGKSETVFDEHLNEIRSLTLLSNGHLASGSIDRTIRIWNPKKEKSLKILNGHDGYVTCLKELSNNKLASGSNDNTIRIWDIETGNCLRVLNENPGYVMSLTTLLTGELVSCSNDSRIRIWNAEKGKFLIFLDGHTRSINCITLLLTGDLVSCSSDKSIRIWNAKQGKCSKILLGHTENVNCLTILLTGELASGSDDKTIRIWNPVTGICLKILEGHEHLVKTLTVLSDGKLVSSSYDRKICLWSDKKCDSRCTIS